MGKGKAFLNVFQSSVIFSCLSNDDCRYCCANDDATYCNEHNLAKVLHCVVFVHGFLFFSLIAAAGSSLSFVDFCRGVTSQIGCA